MSNNKSDNNKHVHYTIYTIHIVLMLIYSLYGLKLLYYLLTNAYYRELNIKCYPILFWSVSWLWHGCTDRRILTFMWHPSASCFMHVKWHYNRYSIGFGRWNGKLIVFVRVLSGPRGHDLLLPDPRLGGAHRGGGEPPPQILPPRLLRLHWQLQCGVHTRQPQDHRQRPASAQVCSLYFPPSLLT